MIEPRRTLCCVVNANSIALSPLEIQRVCRTICYTKEGAHAPLQIKDRLESENIVKLLRSRSAAAAGTIALLFVSVVPAQEQGGDKVDLGPLTQIKNEAFQHSQVMENLF
jgi:hypothetical protein